MHAGRHKHLQQSEQGGLYSPSEWVSVSFVAVMWTSKMDVKGNEQRWVEGNCSGDSSALHLSPRNDLWDLWDGTSMRNAHENISRLKFLIKTMQKCRHFFPICHKLVCKILDFFFFSQANSRLNSLYSLLFTRGRVPHFLKWKLNF